MKEQEALDRLGKAIMLGPLSAENAAWLADQQQKERDWQRRSAAFRQYGIIPKPNNVPVDKNDVELTIQPYEGTL